HPLADELQNQLRVYREWVRDVEQFEAQEQLIAQTVLESGEAYRLATESVTEYGGELAKLRDQSAVVTIRQREQQQAIDRTVDSIIGGAQAMGDWNEAQQRASVQQQGFMDHLRRVN